MDDRAFLKLLDYCRRVPGVEPISHGAEGSGWWMKLVIDIDHPLAWSVVQEFGYVLNELSLTERLPTVFKPISPPPYLNGGPKDFLSWVIESDTQEFRPGTCAEWLEGRLPRPVEDESQWSTD